MMQRGSPGPVGAPESGDEAAGAARTAATIPVSARATSVLVTEPAAADAFVFIHHPSGAPRTCPGDLLQ